MHGLAASGGQDQGLFHIEGTVSGAADGEVAVACIPQPGEVVLGGDAAVEDDEGAGGGAQGSEQGFQGLVFPDVAGEHPGAAHEAAGVQRQSQSEQRAVRAFFLGVAAPGIGLFPGLALEVGVGDVVQGDGGGQIKQVAGVPEQVLLYGVSNVNYFVRSCCLN